MFNLFNKKPLPNIAKKWLPYFYQFNIREKHFWLEKDRLREKFAHNPSNVRKKYGVEPTDGDVIWSMFNAVLQTCKKDWEIASVMKNQAQYLWEDKGKIEHAKILQQEADLIMMRKIADSVEIRISKDSCDKCKKLDGKVFTLEEARKKRILPQKRCTHKYGCRCWYRSVEK